MKTTLLKIAAAGVVALASTPAFAATINGGSAAGQDLYRGVTEGTDAVVYSEATGVTVDANSNVTVDFLVGTNLMQGVATSGINTFSSGQTLTAGTYDSHLIHFDPTSGMFAPGSTTVAASGSWDFGATIVGIILSNGGSQSLLNDSDALFGTAARYDDHLGRRSEVRDSITLTSATELAFTFSTNTTHVDNIRVLTQAAVPAVPVPASGLLLIAGLGAMGAMRRKASKKA